MFFYKRATQQFNGREGETATLLSRCPLKSNGLGGGFAPRHLSRWVLSCKIGVCMKKTAFLIFLVLFCGSSLLAQTKLTQEEYAVYASVLKVIYEHNRKTYSNKSEFVFINETKVDSELELPASKRYKNLISDFNRRNLTSAIIEKKFSRGAYSETYYLTTQAEVDELFKKGRIEAEKRRVEAELNSSGRYLGSPTASCMLFYQKYPESSGHYNLSRVGFSGQFAMIQVKGDLCWNGFSRNYILKKIKGKWKIITFDGSEWIS
ncbi:MAG: hypothetical protein ACR2L1_02115 [Pyrinomonadaceae bacterium]